MPFSIGFTVLMILALFCFAAAGLGGFFYSPDPRPHHIGWIGVFFAVLAFLIR